MSKDMLDYYKSYHRVMGERGYSMGATARDTSRVLFLKEHIQQFADPNSKILDVGCGDLYLSTLLPQYQWQGIDIGSPDHAPKDKILQHDISNVPYPLEKGTYDMAICSEVLEHVWDPYTVCKEIHRLLKPTGTFVMSTPNFDHIDWVLTRHRDILFNPQRPHLIEHIRHYNLDTHTKMLEECGFQVVLHHGADAHYSAFFLNARAMLKQYLVEQIGLDVTDGNVDQLIGMMFPDCSHTIMIVARPVAYIGNSTYTSGGL